MKKTKQTGFFLRPWQSPFWRSLRPELTTSGTSQALPTGTPHPTGITVSFLTEEAEPTLELTMAARLS